MTTAGAHFVDAEGRRLLLRGVNVGGSSKVPSYPPGATHLSERFYDHRSVSFVNRPFPVKEAAGHFERLRDWGFTVIRLLVPWEAVEHAGPGEYDSVYLEYLVEIAARAEEQEFGIIIDFHQDCYSRFTGGDGAPGWTLELAGMDLRRMDETAAAITHQMHTLAYEKMIWPTNGQKLGAATMFTLFFAGGDFAPKLKVEGRSIQTYLQDCYLEAIKTVASRLKDHPNIIGYDVMNEPLSGYIGCKDLSALPGEPRIGAIPSPLQSMALGAGLPQRVPVFRFGAAGSRRIDAVELNPAGASIWSSGECIWRTHGVWEPGPDGSPRVLRPDHFSVVAGRPVDFNEDYYLPFLERCSHVLRSVHPSCLVFLEPAVGVGHVAPLPPKREGIVSAPHWYDGAVLMLKDYIPWLGANSLTRRPVFGPGPIRRSFKHQLETLASQASAQGPPTPTLIGEVGVPFDRRSSRVRSAPRGSAETRIEGNSGRPDPDSRAMNRSLRALDDALLSYVVWNYTADNDPEHGDQWNEEDLSIYSSATGGRALSALVRPYPRAVAGTPVRLFFEPLSRHFVFLFEGDERITAPTEIYLPNHHYGVGFEARLSDGSYDYLPEVQLLRYRPEVPNRLHRIEIRPNRG